MQNDKFTANCDILVVNDGSTDDTSDLAKTTGVKVIDLPANLGVGGAVQTACKYASRGGYDFLVQFDADGQHQSKYIPKLIETVSEKSCNIAIGSRFMGEGNYEMKGLRKLASTFLSKFVSIFAKAKLTDVTSGFRALDKNAINFFSYNTPKYYLGDTVVVVVVAIRNGFIAKGVPVEMKNRQGGVPSSNFIKSTLYLIRAVFVLLLSLTVKAENNIKK